MIFFKRKKPEHKLINNNTGSILLMNEQASKPRNMRDFQEEGYATNPTIYRCVREIAANAARIPLYVENSKGEEIEKHPLLDLLNSPSLMQTKSSFIQEIFTDFQTVGNAYIFASSEVKPKELLRLDPVKIDVEPGAGGIPRSYIYNKGQASQKTYPVDPLTGKTQVLHRKTVNPLNHWYGLPPLKVAAIAGDLHNEGLTWNYSLLKNGGRPSGALTIEGNPSEEAINRLKEMKNKMFGGSRAAGSIPIFSGGMKWQSLSESPKDMDFGTSLNAADKYIAMVYGVPLPLIGTDAATFNNIELAQEKLYEDTIIPLMDDFIADLNRWLVPMFGDDVKICYDLDKIPALEKKRQRLFERAKSAVDSGIITRDEAREMMDFEPIGGAASELLVSSTLTPIDYEPESQVQQDNQKLYNALRDSGYDEKEAVEVLKKDFGICDNGKINA